MDDPAYPSVERALILKADRLYAELLRQYILREFPRVHVTLVSSVAAASAALAANRPDLFVTGIGASLEGDVLELLSGPPPHAIARGVIVVTARPEYRMLAALRSFSVAGVFDTASEPPDNFRQALRKVAVGGRYWSATTVNSMESAGAGPHTVLRQLSISEQMVLSVVGDGSDDATAARILEVSPMTVGAIRRELHRKLHVQHRGELVRAAAQFGFVRFTPEGVFRPGFALLTAAYHRRKGKPLHAEVLEPAH